MQRRALYADAGTRQTGFSASGSIEQGAVVGFGSERGQGRERGMGGRESCDDTDKTGRKDRPLSKGGAALDSGELSIARVALPADHGSLGLSGMDGSAAQNTKKSSEHTRQTQPSKT